MSNDQKLPEPHEIKSFAQIKANLIKYAEDGPEFPYEQACPKCGEGYIVTGKREDGVHICKSPIREGSATMTDEIALSMLWRFNNWAFSHRNSPCTCGGCFVCAIRYIEARLKNSGQNNG